MKMKNVKIKLTLVLFLLAFAIPATTHAQFFKKLKKNVEEKIVQKASDKTDELLSGKEDEIEMAESEGLKPSPTSKNKNTQTSKTSQKPTKKKSPAINDANVITYRAPSTDFIDVVIQSHKGLPRYGDLYFLRGTTTPTNNKAYETLVEFKFLKDVYDDMDRSKLTKYDRAQTGDQKTKNSLFAQRHLLTLAGFTCSDAVLKEYFCDSDAKISCNFYDQAGDRKHLGHWGDTRNNEFAQMRSYSGFLKKYFQPLEDWSQTFYKDGSQIAYYVGRAMVSEKYDFKNKGYWINNIISMIGGSYMLHHSEFLAYTESGKALKTSGKKFFVAVEPPKAKELNLQQRSPVFAVLKVKVFPKVQNANHVAFEYELESQIIEIYRDASLGQKIGEIDLTTLVSKY